MLAKRLQHGEGRISVRRQSATLLEAAQGVARLGADAPVRLADREAERRETALQLATLPVVELRFLGGPRARNGAAARDPVAEVADAQRVGVRAVVGLDG